MINDNRFDYIICGGGLSGLVLVYFLSKSNPTKKILVIDQKPQTLSHKTFSFWYEKGKEFEFQDLIFKTWNSIEFRSQTFSRIHELKNYSYNTIKGNDLEDFIKNSVSNNVEFQTAKINSIHENSDNVIVITDKGIFNSEYGFNSTDFHKQSDLKQYFIGWEIETSDPTFDENVARMFDFQRDNENGCSFFYLLPYTSNKSLIEAVSHTILNENILKKYIENTLYIKNYQIVYQEAGYSNLTETKYKHTYGSRIINIGKSAGLLKPSTGYGFTNILKQSREIVNTSLKTNGLNEYKFGHKTSFYSITDSLFLKILKSKPSNGQKIFETMFKNLDADLIFKFLDEETSIWEIGKMGIGLMPVLHLFIGAFI